MVTFQIKQGDTYPTLRVQLIDETGVAYALPAGSTVTFSMGVSTTSKNPVVDNQAASVVNAGTGIVEYKFTAAQTVNAGNFKGEFRVTLSGGDVKSFPGDSYIPIKVVSKLTTS